MQKFQAIKPDTLRLKAVPYVVFSVTALFFAIVINSIVASNNMPAVIFSALTLGIILVGIKVVSFNNKTAVELSIDSVNGLLHIITLTKAELTIPIGDITSVRYLGMPRIITRTSTIPIISPIYKIDSNGTMQEGCTIQDVATILVGINSDIKSVQSKGTFILISLIPVLIVLLLIALYLLF